MNTTGKAMATAIQRRSPIAVIVWTHGYDTPTRLNFDDPLDALMTAIAYLRRRYHVRLTDAACEALDGIAELERLLSPDDGGRAVIRAAVARTAEVAAGAAAPRGGNGAVPVGDRLRVPAATFSGPAEG